MTKEELEKLKNFKVYVFDEEVYVKASDYKKIAVENKELKNRCEHLTKIITYIMERENICYIDDGEYGWQIVE